jgi:lambda family phage portal protein
MFSWLFPKKKPKKRSYQGALYNRLTSDWFTTSTSADSEILGDLRTLRNRTRDLVRNNDYAKNAVRVMTNNIVGKGISLQSQVMMRRGGKLDEKLNTEIEEAWQYWISAEYCHTAGVLGFQDIEQLIVKSLIESGEVLVRLVRQPFAGSPVPLALEIIESDQLADEYTSGGDKRLGIEVDQWQRPVAYHLYPYHPGDYQFSGNYQTNRVNRIPSNEIIHLFICDRPGQSRGVPWFHSAISRLRNIGGYEEAEIVAARAQANVMGFIQSPDSEFFGSDENGNRITKLAPGAIETLQPGEVFSGFAPTRPNQGFDPFMRCMLRGVAAGIGMSYESLSRDYSNTSYSSARTALIDERDAYRVIQAWLIRKFHRQVFKSWLSMAYLASAISLPGYERSPMHYCKDKWVARGWQWVDPESEVAAYKEAIKAGFTTISEVVAQTGQDVEDVFKERRRELDLATAMELKFDTELSEEVASSKEQVASEEKVASEEEEEKVDLQKMFGDRSVELPISYFLPPTSEKRAKNCKKGKACGNSCISQAKQCRKDLSPAATAASKDPVAKNAGKKGQGRPRIRSYKQLIKAGEKVTNKNIQGKLVFKEFREFYDYFHSSERVNQTEVDNRVGSIDFIGFNKKSKDFAVEAINDYQRLVKGKLTDIEKVENAKGRAFCRPDLKKIASEFDPMDTGMGKKVAYHELSHLLENQYPDIQSWVTKWRDSRAESKKLVSLKELRGDKNYASHEVAVKDKFIKPYVGKVYPGIKDTEVLSMGLEYFSSPSRMKILYEKDRDHFNLMVGILEIL